MNKTIWCLFSIDNQYDQPRNNLIAWFSAMPTIDSLNTHFDKQMCVDLLRGKKVKGIANTEYRLEEVIEGPHNKLEQRWINL